MALSLNAAFALEPLGELSFRAPAIATDERRVFGGLIFAQALSAASATVEAAECHSMHALFSAAAAVDRPLDITVSRLRDGRKFAARRVEAWQGDRLILAALASFHTGESGPEHAIAMPVLPQPETLSARCQVDENPAQFGGARRRRYAIDIFFDVRSVEMALDQSNGIQGQQALWFKPRVAFFESPGTRRAALAFASDMGLVHVGLQPYQVIGNGEPLEAASLDHAIWFHRDPPAGDWLVHVQRAPIAGSGRGMAYGNVFTRNGQLVATTAQEFLCREKAAQHR